MSLKPL